MATCEMVLNNTSWQISNAPCPLSQNLSPYSGISGHEVSGSPNQPVWAKATL